MPELRALGRLASERFSAYLAILDPEVPQHRIEFSGRITGSWALIYYRRHLVRLSPYLFLLDTSELQYGTHWKELDATLRHEAAHAYAFHHHGDVGHSPAFHRALEKLGLTANGACDLGPENAAFRYVYACNACDSMWQRRVRLRGNWSCGGCAPGRFDPTYRLQLREERNLGRRLRDRREAIAAAFVEGSVIREAAESVVCEGSSSSGTPLRAPLASL